MKLITSIILTIVSLSVLAGKKVELYRLLDSATTSSAHQPRFASAFGIKGTLVDFDFLDSPNGRWDYYEMSGKHCLYTIDRVRNKIVSDYYCSYSYSFWSDIGNTVAEFNGQRYGDPDTFEVIELPIADEVNHKNKLHAVVEKFTTRSGTLNALSVYKDSGKLLEKILFKDAKSFEDHLLSATKQLIPARRLFANDNGTKATCSINLIPKQSVIEFQIYCDIDDISTYDVDGELELLIKHESWIDFNILKISAK